MGDCLCHCLFVCLFVWSPFNLDFDPLTVKKLQEGEAVKKSRAEEVVSALKRKHSFDEEDLTEYLFVFFSLLFTI